MLYPGIQRIGKWVGPRTGPNVLLKRKTLAPAEIRTRDDPSISLIAVPTELSRLLREKVVQNCVNNIRIVVNTYKPQTRV